MRTMGNLTGYIVVTLCCAIIMAGYVASAVVTGQISQSPDSLWLILPSPLWFLAGFITDRQWLTPRFLMRGKYVRYALLLTLLMTVCSLCGIESECLAGNISGEKIHSYSYFSVRVLTDAMGNATMFILMSMAVAIRTIYDEWSRRTRETAASAEQLQLYIEEVRKRLNPDSIMSRLRGICSSFGVDVNESRIKMADLADSLREELYFMPPMPGIEVRDDGRTERDSIILRILCSRKYHVLRHIILAGVLAGVSINCGLNYPSENAFTFNFLPVVCMFIFLMATAETIILYLFQKCKSGRNMRGYLWRLCFLGAIYIIPMGFVQIWAGLSAENVTLFWRLMAGTANTAGLVVTMAFYMGGLTGVLLLQDLLRVRQRKAELRLETVRYEYIFLRKHINPHFLFNVLNNIYFVAGKEASVASSLITKLTSLMERMFSAQSHQKISIGDEIDYLKDYLDLEVSRKDGLSYTLTEEGIHSGVKIPSLIFIPFVENAVKYSSTVSGEKCVEISFREDGRFLIFECTNKYDNKRLSDIPRGELGVGNTLRRIRLLFDTDYSYEVRVSHNLYQVRIKLPIR